MFILFNFITYSQENRYDRAREFSFVFKSYYAYRLHNFVKKIEIVLVHSGLFYNFCNNMNNLLLHYLK